MDAEHAVHALMAVLHARFAGIGTFGFCQDHNFHPLFANTQDAPISRIDKDEENLWWPQASSNVAGASYSPRDKAVTTDDQAVR